MRKRSAIVIGTTVAQGRALGVQPGVVFSRGLNRLAQRFAGGIALAAIALLAATPSAGASGASLVRDINPGGGSYPGFITKVGRTALFVADDGTRGDELWRSDGTAAGTRLVRHIWPGASGSFLPGDEPTNVGGTLFFSADDGTHGFELWRSDGTAAGTRLVRDISAGGSSRPSGLTDVGRTLFFVADDGTRGRELWRSNGTRKGTKLVRNIYPGRGNSYPRNLTNFGGTLFLGANDGTHGTELWRSNGTAAGTRLVRDIKPGAVDSYPIGPAFLTNVGGTLFFTADDGIHGHELWRSDGTAAGTRLVRDIKPGAVDSFPYSPYDLTNVGGRLFFSADDGTHGYELWKAVP